MFTNSDMTLFNRYYDKDEDCYKYTKTYLRGVNWQDSKSVIISSTGVTSEDSTRIFIPLNVDSEEKKYYKPKSFKKIEDKSKIYTFDNEDIVVKGIIDFDVNALKGISQMQKDCDDVMTITKVIDNRYGTRGVQHFELEVK